MRGICYYYTKGNLRAYVMNFGLFDNNNYYLIKNNKIFWTNTYIMHDEAIKIFKDRTL